MSLQGFMEMEYARFPALDMSFNPDLFNTQQSARSCAVAAQNSILEDFFGTDFDEDRLAVFAQDNGMFDPTFGTPSENRAGVLEKLGFSVERLQEPTLDELIEKVGQGNQVLVGVDTHELYRDEPLVYGDHNPNHAIRILGDDLEVPENCLFLDPGMGEVSIPRMILEPSIDGLHADIIQHPHESMKELIQSRLYNEVSTDDLAEYKINKLFTEGHSEYFEEIQQNLEAAGLSSEAGVGGIPEGYQEEVNAIGLDVGNLVATGAFMAIVDYYKDNPEKGKRVTKVAIGLGAFDALTEFGPEGIDVDFEVNPLLIASLAYYVTQYKKFPENSFRARMAVVSSKVLARGMKAIEYGGYAAIAIEVIDFITDFGLAEGILELIDGLDFLDILPDLAADGASIIDGIASLGLGILASKFVRYAFKKWNKKDLDRFKHLTQKTLPKKTLVELLENGAPPQILLGPYVGNLRI